MMSTMSMRQPENWLYEIWQKGQDSPCYVMVPNAKDLVKSHLMIAVREEVEVLKEKISELMDKINQLEVENTILKANISQETLQQLQMQTQLQIAGNGTAPGSNMIAAAPPAQSQQPQQPQQQQQQQQQSSTAAAAVTDAATAAASPASVTAETAENVAATATATATTPAAAATVADNGAAAMATTNGPMP